MAGDWSMRVILDIRDVCAHELAHMSAPELPALSALHSLH